MPGAQARGAVRLSPLQLVGADLAAPLLSAGAPSFCISAAAIAPRSYAGSGGYTGIARRSRALFGRHSGVDRNPSAGMPLWCVRRNRAGPLGRGWSRHTLRVRRESQTTLDWPAGLMTWWAPLRTNACLFN